MVPSLTGDKFLSGGGDGVIKLWDAGTWKPTAKLNLGKGRVNDIVFNHTSTRFASASEDNSLALWKTPPLNQAPIIIALKDEPMCLAFSKEGPLLVSGMNNGSLIAWDSESAQELHTFSRLQLDEISPITTVDFAPQGRRGVAGCTFGNLYFWDFDQAAKAEAAWIAAQRARHTLENNPMNAQALQDLGEWFKFRECWNWAAEILEEASAQGAIVSSLTLAKCNWLAGRFEKAEKYIRMASAASEGPAYYLQLCTKAILQQWEESVFSASMNRDEPVVPPNSTVLQPGPRDANDLWTTSYYGGAEGGGDTGGGGQVDEQLRVGGWGDLYHSLLQFKLEQCPQKAKSAILYLFCEHNGSHGTPIFLHRIKGPWDWRHTGTGRDHDRLWFKDRAETELWQKMFLPEPKPNRWYGIDITDLYNGWKNGKYPNFGIELQPVLNFNGEFNYFHSSRFMADPHLRPMLIITPEDQQRNPIE